MKNWSKHQALPPLVSWNISSLMTRNKPWTRTGCGKREVCYLKSSFGIIGDCCCMFGVCGIFKNRHIGFHDHLGGPAEDPALPDAINHQEGEDMMIFVRFWSGQ